MLNKDLDPIYWNRLRGFLVGLAVMTLYIYSYGLRSPDTIMDFETCCRKGIPVSISKYGGFYLWDEKSKTSIHISITELRNMAGVKNVSR